MDVPRSRTATTPLLNPIWSALLPLGVFFYLYLSPARDPVFDVPVDHFYIVSTASIIAAIIAIVMGISGTRLRNMQVILISLAFISLTILFGLHGLSTPGMLLPFTRVVSVASQLSVFMMALWLWLSSLPSDNPLIARLSDFERYLILVWTVFLLAASALMFALPDLVAWVPVDQAPLRWFVTAVTVLLSLAASYRYWRSYRYAKFPFQLAIAHTGGLIAVVQIIIVTAELWRLSWWLYHFLLLIALIVTVIGLYQQYSLGASLTLAVRGLFSVDPGERLEAGISPSVRALVAATEARDPYTAGHSRRVAENALRLGKKMALSPEKLRALAQGAILHDVGKIEVPDYVLKKPGPLSDEERRLIERHPITGYEMCVRLGFMRDELEIIRCHHERPDGNGYPDSLLNGRIPKLCLLLTVVDVFDALISDRSYRPAWTVPEALTYLRENAGSQFDTQCVDHWISLVSSGKFASPDRT